MHGFCKLPCLSIQIGSSLFHFLCTGIAIYAIFHVNSPLRVKMANSMIPCVFSATHEIPISTIATVHVCSMMFGLSALKLCCKYILPHRIACSRNWWPFIISPTGIWWLRGKRLGLICCILRYLSHVWLFSSYHLFCYSPALLQASKDFTVLIKNWVEFPKFNSKR